MSAYRPKTSLIPAPTFSEYERAAKSVKSKIQFLKLKEKDDFRLNLSHFSQIGKADILFLCNPNNPTGNLILEDYRAIERLSNKSNSCAQGTGKLLVVDEAFMDFLPNEKNHTLIWRAIENRNMIVLRTFTKFFCLPGLRIGYLIAHKEIINKLNRHRPPWNTNTFAQIAAELILNDKEYIKNTYRAIKEEREFLSGELAKINGLRFYPSVTNFLLIKIGDKDITSSVLVKKLIKRKILIRDCSNFRGLNNKFIRIAVRSHKENLKLIATLKEVL